MLKQGFAIFWMLLKFIGVLFIPVGIAAAIFAVLCVVWFLIFKYRDKMEFTPPAVVPPEKRSIFKQLFVDLPRRYVMDIYEREPDFFRPQGIHMFCGEQGCGKTMACVEMMLRYQKMYPNSKMITNFAVSTEDDELTQWQQLLDYTNEKKGVIVGIDEIQNWFMSGKNQLPEGMLEVATQNRKNRRVICCTAQVFTRVNKGLREQVTNVYEPHTFLGCFTVVFKKKYKFDSEGQVAESKFKGMYCFVHTEELRSAYDTYKVIHTLAKEGFKEMHPAPVTNVYVDSAARRK